MTVTSIRLLRLSVLKIRRTAHTAFLGLLAGAALFFLFVFTGAALSQAPPQLDAHGNQIPATLPYMYEYAFHFQIGLEKLAVDHERAGEPGIVFRTFLPLRFKVTEEQFAPFEAAAKRFDQREKEIEAQIRAAKAADRATHPATRPLSQAARADVHELLVQVNTAASDETAAIHAALEPAVAQKIDDAVIRLYNQEDGITLHLAPGSTVVPRRSAAPGAGPGTWREGAQGLASKPSPEDSGGGDPCYDCPTPTITGVMNFSSDGSTVLSTMTATISEDDLEDGCFPFIFGEIDQNGDVDVDGTAYEEDVTATVSLSADVVVGDSYQINASAETYDVDGYSYGTVLFTATSFTTGAPNISSVSTASGAAGTSGTIVATGYDLGGPPGNTPTVSVDGTDLSITASGATQYSGSNSNAAYGTQNLTYSIPADTPINASDSYTLKTVWGTSTSSVFSVVCGQPTVTGISPATWDAGKKTSITITGTGFCPGSSIASITVSTGSVSFTPAVFVSSTELTSSVTPADTDPTESALVTVSNPASAATQVIRSNQLKAHANATAGDIGGGSSSGTAEVAQASDALYLIDPYPSPLSGSTSLSESTIIANLTNTAVEAGGIIADGTSTAIAVYASSVNSPVTFTTYNGMTLATWSSSFLSSAPATGTSTCPSTDCTVTQIQQGSTYYSFVLVQAPKQSNTVSYSASEVSAGIASWEQTAQYLIVYPTPVIFVHGLWGNASSLASVKTTLTGTAPWSDTGSAYTALSTLCYSIVLPFDVTSDPSGASSCTLSSQTALNNQIKTVLSSLDNAKVSGTSGTSGAIVGGRVDLVVHSMGGLAARHYSSTSLYKTTRSRMQGAFRTIVTLDTPENGSGLATFLLKPTVAGGTCSQAKGGVCYPSLTTGTPTTVSGLVWWAKCGSNPATTLASCLAPSQPLGPAGSGPGGLNISACTAANASGSAPGCGSVASLQPGSPNITALPSAQIPNSTWVAVGADWQDNNVAPYSLARLSLNTMIAALAISGSPTTSSALGSIDNDVIVTTTSQFWNTGGVQHAEYLGRAHFSLGWAANIASYFSSYSNSNVTTDADVASCAGTALMTAATSTCTGASITGLGGATLVVPAKARQTVQLSRDDQSIFPETEDERVERMKRPFVNASQRLVAKVSGVAVPLGNWLTIPTTFAPGKLVSLHVSQSAPGRNALPQELLPVKVMLEGGLPSAIQIVPAQLGPLTVDIAAVYSDNGTVTQKLHLNVVPNAQGLKTFSLDQGTHHIPLVLEDAEQDRQISLNPTLLYNDLRDEISLDDAKHIKLTVEQDESAPVVRVDSDGLVHALREGDAVITGNFDGAIDKVTVHVYTKEKAPAGYRRVPQQ